METGWNWGAAVATPNGWTEGLHQPCGAAETSQTTGDQYRPEPIHQGGKQPGDALAAVGRANN